MLSSFMRSSDNDHTPLAPGCSGLDEISRRLGQRSRRILHRPKSAAVLICLVDDGKPPRLILTRRSEKLPTHKGQVAFPGGGLEPGDKGPIDAALREAEEEIGLSREHVEVLGVLDDFPTITNEVRVTPVVARLETLPDLRPEPSEVARVFLIPLSLLQEPERWTSRVVERNAQSWPVYYFEHDGETLWGLSAYMLLHFLDACRLKAPFSLPEIEIT